jgi:hypothetical protein
MTTSGLRKQLGIGAVLLLAVGGAAFLGFRSFQPPPAAPDAADAPRNYRPRLPIDPGGRFAVMDEIEHWDPFAPLEEIGRRWNDGPKRLRSQLDKRLANPELPSGDRIQALIFLASVEHYDGEPERAYSVLERARQIASEKAKDAEETLYTVIYYQGVTALRCGETENCVLCRGEGACVLPLAPSAVHTKPSGSRRAIKHFTEYLEQFPDDFSVRWLLNVAHMTLGEHPDKVDPRFVIRLDAWQRSEFDLGRFLEIGERVGINRYNEAGAAIMDDFDNDGLYDILFTSWNQAVTPVLYKNMGNGRFEDVTQRAKLTGQFGGLGAVQGDFDNDGHLDIFLPRGAWLRDPVRPSLLRNNGDGTFTDVTEKAGLLDPVNSDTVSWVDFDNDGHLDLFVACERQRCRLYRNRGNGTFEDVTEKAGLASYMGMWKGVAWLDYDNDGYPDLFLNNFEGGSRLFHNNGNGTFTEVTKEMGIDGPDQALSCWAWDYDNDGYLDIFAPSFGATMESVVKELAGQPSNRGKNRLYRNLGGKGFKDVSKEVGLDTCFLPMGTNFGDFDNDGYLDFYLGTGDHDLATLVPNRMFKNVGGKRFADVTAATRTGNLQKGHGVACGDWDRNGTVDIVIQMGGAVPGDAYHNLLFQNPGQGNNWLSVKLVGAQTPGGTGKKSNRSAIGARIKAVTDGAQPLTVHRHVSSGSSFGGNPLEQHIGLGKATTVATLEITWPASGTVQTFHNVPVNRAIEITEFAKEYKVLDRKPVPLPK